MLGNEMRVDIDLAIYPSKSSTTQYALTKMQSDNSILSQNVINTQNKNLLSFNWVHEKWVPIDVKCYGEVFNTNIQN